MARFGTIEVYEELATLLNADPEWADKGRAINYSMVFDYDEPVNAAFFVKFDEGRITDLRELVSADAEPADFIISGAPDVWRGVLENKISPTAALTSGQLKLKGKTTTLLKHMKAFSHIIDTMTMVRLV